MALPLILLAAQAAGLGMDLYATRKASKSMKMGFELDAANAENKIEQLRLQGTEDALFNLDRLRQNISTQRAISGARGQSSSTGSARGAILASERTYTADERARELSERFKTFDIRSDIAAGRIAGKAQRRQLGTQFAQRAFQTIGTQGLQGAFEGIGKKLNAPKGGSKL